MSSYPDSIFDPRTKENKAGVEFNPLKKNVLFAEDLSLLDSEIVAMQTILGLNPQGEYETIGAYLSALSAAIVPGITDFLELSDTPETYTNKANFSVKVNSTADGITFVEDVPEDPDVAPLFYGFQSGGPYGKPTSIDVDSDGIYCVHSSLEELIKWNRSTLSREWTTSTSSINLMCVSVDSNYAYLFAETGNCYKVTKTTGALDSGTWVNVYPKYSVNDDDYIYVADLGTNKIKKIQKSTLSVVATSADSFKTVGQRLCQDDDYIYCVKSTGGDILQLKKADLTTNATLNSINGDILDFDTDGTWLFISASAENGFSAYKLSDFNYPYFYFTYANDVSHLRVSGDYIISIDSSTSKAYLHRISEKSFLTESLANTETDAIGIFDYPDLIYGGSTYNRINKRPLVDFVIKK